MADLLATLRQQINSSVRADEPLARHTSARVGGPADFFLVVRSATDVVQAVDTAESLGIPWTVIGSASNVLIADEGVAGLVLKQATKGLQIRSAGGCTTAEVEAGTLVAAAAQDTVTQGYAGLEWSINVPGTVGAAVVNNSGAFGSSTYEHLLSADLYLAGAGVQCVAAADLRPAYRTTLLKSGALRGVVLRGVFQLEPGDPVRLGARLREIQAQRRATQPTGFSLGSMFTNPPGDHAGRLIEAAGLKGLREGQVEVATLHANLMLARNGARAQDVVSLLGRVQQAVWRDGGVWLRPEIQLLGRWPGGFMDEMNAPRATD